ncbi:MAG: lipid-A-disaccharide synthase [Bacteroidales bacterium]|mgnify:CR=1 FL=1|nr:lipid-A-disaccharide synthase [Bacteroidales bacterium]
MRYYLIAGEASGDLHASNLMAELKRRDDAAEFRFYGGDKMAAVGGTLVKHYRELAYMGFIPVLMHLPQILKNMRQCKADIAEWKPDVVVLVDYPGFNLDIAAFVRARGICKVYYYISPKIWAWKEYRIKNIRRDVDELFSILPFEVKWFEERDYKVHYVGNPCVDAVEKWKREEAQESQQEAKRDGKRQIAILAGSRRQEIKDNLRMMVESAAAFKDYHIVIAGAPNIDEAYYHDYLPKDVEVEIRFGQTYQILKDSVAALVTSGTATLETAILRVPQVVCYAMPLGKLASWLKSKILKVKYVSLVNLVVDREIVQELVADRMTRTNIIHYLGSILPGGEARQQMLDDYEEMNSLLGGEGASRRAAEEMLRLLKADKERMDKSLLDEEVN